MTGFAIDEHIAADSTVIVTALMRDGARLAVSVGARVIGHVPDAAVQVVLRRYGRPLADEVVPLVADAPRLALSDGWSLVRLHWRAAVDAAGRDYLVLVGPDAEPVGALSPMVGAAIVHLAQRR